MDSDEHNPFGDIEQDNNPSFYGNPSVINDPYGHSHQSEVLAEDDIQPLVEGVPSYEEQVSASALREQAHPEEQTHSHAHTHVHNASHRNGGVQSLQGQQQPHRSDRFARSSANGGLNINDSLVISSKIASLIHEDISIKVISTEKLVSSSSVIVYCIELRLKSTPPGSGIIVKRRYSEFKSLRDNLMRLFPTLIIPPIPQKHTLLTYLITSLNNNEEISIIETRKRLFECFLNDLILHSNPRIRDCLILHKFLDPNYEMCWENALNEPPITLIPDNLLLANPINPINQNGLYSLLPVLNGYEPGSSDGMVLGDNLGSLKRLNEDLKKLSPIIRIDAEDNGGVKQESSGAASLFTEIPNTLMNFEASFSHSIKITTDLDKLNTRTSTHLKLLVSTLIELGSNLNNFSLQIHSPDLSGQTIGEREINLANQVEKFGSTIDSVFLNYESYTMNSFIPKWQEPIHQLIQHYLTAIQLLRFYKLKLIQFKILKKARARKTLELDAMTNSLDSQSNINDALKNGLSLNSPSITEAVKKFEQKQRKFKKSLLVGNKKSWYGLFGGKAYSNLNYETLKQANEQQQTPVGGKLYATEELSNAQQYQYKHKIEQIEQEINKLDQLISLTNNDMIELTKDLEINFQEFLNMLEKRWLMAMLEFIRGGKKLFQENLQSWEGMKSGIPDITT